MAATLQGFLESVVDCFVALEATLNGRPRLVCVRCTLVFEGPVGMAKQRRICNAMGQVFIVGLREEGPTTRIIIEASPGVIRRIRETPMHELGLAFGVPVVSISD